jgi:hypothetical protein
VTRYWAYQTFTASNYDPTTTTFTITQNENADVTQMASTALPDTATVTAVNGTPLYKGIIWLSPIVSVDTQVGNIVKLDNTWTGTKTFRIWYLLAGVKPTGAMDAPKHVIKDTIAWLEAAYLNVDGDTMYGNIDMGGYKITDLVSPMLSGDAVNLQYMENSISALSGIVSGNISQANSDLSGSLTLDIGILSGNLEGQINDLSYTLTDDITIARKSAYHQSSTGILSGGILSINTIDNESFDLTAGTGVIVDRTDLSNPIEHIVTWNAVIRGTDPFLETDQTTYIYVDADGSINFTPTWHSESERRQHIEIGWLDHPGNLVIENAGTEPVYAQDAIQQMNDFLENYGAFSIYGNLFTPNADLTLTKTEGAVFDNSANYANDPNNPHVIYQGVQNPVTFNYYYRQNSLGDWINNLPSGITIDSDRYDTGTGTLANVPIGWWTIQPISYYSLSDQTSIQYGQNIYPSRESAYMHLRDTIEVNPYLQYDVLRGRLLVKQGATNLSDTTQCIVINARAIDLMRDLTATNPVGTLTFNYPGLWIVPTITSLSGSVILEECEAVLYKTDDFSDSMDKYVIPGLAVPISPNILTFISADYNGGSPKYTAFQYPNMPNGSSQIGICGAFWEQKGIIDEMHILSTGSSAKGLASKINDRLQTFEGFSPVYDNGFTLSEGVSGHLTLTEGYMWYGADMHYLPEVTSTITEEFMHRYYTVSGEWTAYSAEFYNNTYYDNDAVGLVAVPSGQYGITWIYRLAAEDKSMIGIPDKETFPDLPTAQAKQKPDSVPDIVLFGAFLAGRIIFLAPGVYGSAIISQAKDLIGTGGGSSPSITHNELAGRTVYPSHNALSIQADFENHYMGTPKVTSNLQTVLDGIMAWSANIIFPPASGQLIMDDGRGYLMAAGVSIETTMGNLDTRIPTSQAVQESLTSLSGALQYNIDNKPSLLPRRDKFTLSAALVSGSPLVLPYTPYPESETVIIRAVVQETPEIYSVSGNALIFTETLVSGEYIRVQYMA